MMKKLLLTGAVLGALATNAQAENVFKFSFQGDIQGLDPHVLQETFQIGTMTNVYEPLFFRDKDLKLTPGLATAWKPVSDTKWEIKLRKGVKFHDGADFTAEDVQFTMKRLLGTGFSNIAKKVKGVEIVNDHTVILETTEKNPLIMADLSTVGIMDKDWTTKNNAHDPKSKMDNLYTTKHANGTGAFKAVEYQAGVKTIFVRNKDYWDKNIRTNVDKVILQPIAQDATRVAALISGAVHLAYPIPLQDHDRLNKNDKVKVLAGPETRNIYFGFDQWRDELVGSSVKGKNPFKDKRVRAAFIHAVDVNLIGKKVMRGSSLPSGIMVAKAINGWDAEIAKPYKYDLEKAKRLMAEAGYPNGFKFILDCPNNRYVNDEKICQAVVTMLGKINVKAELLAQPKGQFFKKIFQGGGYNSSMYMLGASASTLDASSNFGYLMRCRDVDAGKGLYNVGNYCNPRIGEIADQAQGELDSNKRLALLREALQITKDDYGFMPIHDQALSWGISNKVDLYQRANNELRFADVIVNK